MPWPRITARVFVRLCLERCANSTKETSSDYKVLFSLFVEDILAVLDHIHWPGAMVIAQALCASLRTYMPVRLELVQCCISELTGGLCRATMWMQACPNSRSSSLV